jgi:hypothetical protein
MLSDLFSSHYLGVLDTGVVQLYISINIRKKLKVFGRPILTGSTDFIFSNLLREGSSCAERNRA